MAKVLELGKGGDFHIKEGGLLAHQELTNGRFVPQPFDVNRGSLATFIGSNGLVQTAANNVPRIETKDSNKHLITEPQSTNLVLQSQELETVWGKESTTALDNVTTSPDGAINASKLTCDISSANHRIRTNVPVDIGLNNTMSVYLKKGSGANSPDNILISGGSGFDFAINVNVSNGVINAVKGAVSDEKSESLKDGWYRFSFMAAATSTTSGGQFRIVFVDNSTSQVSSSFSYNETNSGVDIFIWQAQFEQNILTSTIVTSGVIATRLKDQVTGAGYSTTFNSLEGVLNIKVAALSSTNEGARYITLSDGTVSNVISLFLTGTDTIGVLIFNGSLLWSTSTTVPDLTAFTEISLKYKVNDFGLKIDGVEVATNTSGATFAAGTLTTLSLNNGIAGTTEFYGKTEFINIFDSATDY